ncbi:hypothetical protein PIB30_069667, partial [Stylosanthes scabra]|nr:hypothetical protein [Stylosanthes scabra]
DSIAWSFIPRGNDTHFTVVLLERFGALAENFTHHPGFSSSRATVLGLWNMDKSSMFSSLRTHSLWRKPGVYRMAPTQGLTHLFFRD